jgi:hypothetical protein
VKIRIRGLDKLVAKFERMPDRAREEIRLALKKSTRDIAERARENHRYISRSGATEREGVKAAVDGRAMAGRVWLATDVAVFQHEGTGIYGQRRRPIIIRPQDRLALRWPAAGGAGFVFAKKVTNPGVKPDPYLYNAAEHEREAVISRFEAAIAKICRE